MSMVSKFPAERPSRVAPVSWRTRVLQFTLVAALGFFAAGCKTSGDSVKTSDTPPPPGGQTDRTPPNVTITSPTSGTTFSTSSSSVNVGGTAADNIGVTQVVWQVTWPGNGGNSGTANGTGSWNVSNIALQPGSNVVTITARDAAGNLGSDQLTINYTVAVGNNNATVSWNANTEPDLAGYRVYYGTQSGQYQQSKGTGTVIVGATSHMITGLTAGTRYYFAVTAFDTSGNESGYSQEVFKDILP